ncbi:hypothetical protein D3Z45_18325 [Lachnospiraceae bacterium]|nr:hypothetical protein [Lachnospiraceae bacterium]
MGKRLSSIAREYKFDSIQALIMLNIGNIVTLFFILVPCHYNGGGYFYGGEEIWKERELTDM